MINFKDKKILITGATGGIGKALVKKFLSLDGNVLATGTKIEKLDALKKEFPKVNILKFDILEHSKIEEFIEHVSEDSCKKNLIEMNRCLKKNGKLILTTPNYRSIWPILEFIVSLVTKENYLKQHITHYNRNSLERMMLENGFVNVKVESYIFLSPFFAYLSNDLSNWLFKLENKYIKRWGNLLIAQGEAIGE